jgi:hypothetical protein
LQKSKAAGPGDESTEQAFVKDRRCNNASCNLVEAIDRKDQETDE